MSIRHLYTHVYTPCIYTCLFAFPPEYYEKHNFVTVPSQGQNDFFSLMAMYLCQHTRLYTRPYACLYACLRAGLAHDYHHVYTHDCTHDYTNDYTYVYTHVYPP